VTLLEPIVRPIRDGSSVFGERKLFVVDCLFVFGTVGPFLPITVPISRLRTLRSVERLSFIPDEVERLLSLRGRLTAELTAGCFTPLGAEELRVPMVSPIRERRLFVACFLAFEIDGVRRLLEPPLSEALFERAAG
jgi:hypothetical protein